MALVALTMIGFISCEKAEDVNLSDIEGVYEGSFTILNSLKSYSFAVDDTHFGTAEVHMMENNQIEVHCYGEFIDSTFILDYYQHNDSLMVCLTGEDFERFYGHMPGHGHMGGGMMGDISHDDTEWMHHLHDEHHEWDEHFGGFNLHEMTFTYSFVLKEHSSTYYLRFYGVKQ